MSLRVPTTCSSTCELSYLWQGSLDLSAKGTVEDRETSMKAVAGGSPFPGRCEETSTQDRMWNEGWDQRKTSTHSSLTTSNFFESLIGACVTLRQQRYPKTQHG